MSISITKHDGTKEPFNADRVNRSIERAAKGLSNPVAMVTQIATETQFTLYDGITSEEMDQATINAAVQNIKEDPDYDRIAVRLLLKMAYRKVLGEYDKDSAGALENAHREGFFTYVSEGVAESRLHPDMAVKFDLKKLSEALRIDRDELFDYAGLDTLLRRYSLKDLKQNPVETPQYFFMRIAMGLSYNEADPTAWAIRFYNKMSKLEYVAGGSTNLAAGTTKPSLSNCFLLEIHDDMGHIAKSVSDVMLLSKDSGGLGVSLTKLRSAGSPLKSNNGTSTGPTPFAKIIDTAIRAIQRGGKKKGALCFYMENWHMDFPEFLDWKHNSGDDYMRMRTANTAVFISDEFMKRVEKGEDWYMFDPAETPDLNELYGSAFSARYKEYVEMALTGKMRAFKKVPATEQFRQILTSLQSTSHPWLTWKDTINNRALNNNRGTIHMSNLCTEICLPQDRENIAVCNLASLNLAAHVFNKEVNWSKLEESVRLAIRQLDNLIDINRLSIAEANKSDKENRAIGLGVMGIADTIEKLGMAYDSEHAWDFVDRIFEFVSYMAIDESADLAQERGSYMHFKGSEWSKGKVPIDTIAKVEADRGMAVTVSRESKHKGLNWDVLRAKVKNGMRNSTLMATAPNANIGLVAGTTPGIDVRFAQIFSRNKISGKYIDINKNLVKDLKNMGLWDKVKDEIIESQGDIAEIAGIPDHLKDVYKTSFTTSPYAVIEMAARAQKWVDQGLSRNMYLDTRDIDETMNIYKTAWEKGVKTTYYLHMKPRHTAEQSTVAVNKAQKMGKVGFGAIGLKHKEVAPQSFNIPLQKTLELETMAVPASAQAIEVAQPKEMAPEIPAVFDEPEAVSVIASQPAVSEVNLPKLEISEPVAAVEMPQKPKWQSAVTLAAALGGETEKGVRLEAVAMPEREKVNVTASVPVSTPIGESNATMALDAAPKKKYNVILPEDPGAADICIGCE